MTYTAEKRYEEQLKQSHLESPFVIADEWWSEDLSKCPDIEFGDVCSYYTAMI